MYISDEDEFAEDPHKIIPVEDASALPYIPRQGLEGLTMVMSYQLKLLDFEEPSIMSQVI